LSCRGRCKGAALSPPPPSLGGRRGPGPTLAPAATRRDELRACRLKLSGTEYTFIVWIGVAIMLLLYIYIYIYIDQCDRDGIHPLSCHSQQYEIAQIVFEVAMQVGCMLLVDHSRFIAGASFCLVPAIMLGATGFYSDRFSSRQHSSSGCRVAMSHPSDCSLRQGARPIKPPVKVNFYVFFRIFRVHMGPYGFIWARMCPYGPGPGP